MARLARRRRNHPPRAGGWNPRKIHTAPGGGNQNRGPLLVRAPRPAAHRTAENLRRHTRSTAWLAGGGIAPHSCATGHRRRIPNNPARAPRNAAGIFGANTRGLVRMDRSGSRPSGAARCVTGKIAISLRRLPRRPARLGTPRLQFDPRRTQPVRRSPDRFGENHGGPVPSPQGPAVARRRARVFPHRKNPRPHRCGGSSRSSAILRGASPLRHAHRQKQNLLHGKPCRLRPANLPVCHRLLRPHSRCLAGPRRRRRPHRAGANRGNGAAPQRLPA